MAAFSTRSFFVKPPNKVEFATDKEVADLLGVKNERTIRRYKSDLHARKILGAIAYGKQLRIPKDQDWAKIARELKSLGKAFHVSLGRMFRREMGWGSPRRERDTKILSLALDLERVSQRRRLTDKLKSQLEEGWKTAQITAAKYRCTVFNAPKFFLKHLEAANEKERKHNAPYIEWLKRIRLWDDVRKLIKKGGGDTLFEVDEEFERDGKKGLISHRVNLHSVQTSAQLSRKVLQFMKLWPSPEVIERATAKYSRNWWLLDLDRGAKLLRRQKRQITVKNLCAVLYRDEIAKLRKRPGISRSTYFRRGYSKADLARVRNVTVGNELRVSHKKAGGFYDDLGLDATDLANMSIQSRYGWELYNPFRDEK